MGPESEELPRSSWESALQSLSQEHDGDLVTIETPALDLGDQLEAERLPLAYLEYDRHDDAVSAAVGGRDGRYPVVLRHVIEHPSKVFVATTGPNETLALEVVAADGVKTVITLHRRAALPA
jgi:hypothetical protein